ncbi:MULTISPECIES: SDR family NAD(P)-dependent oxidoreductase [Staphylococcus]|uniref:SDR family NAD(P)-dependent oxidoreductase n=1 Tax=Staphylococcus TaxID=1279 RepID=UPI0021D066F5|nr:SDR family NAD(P)-dependent oxidoreductase [Staphylococcus sp. IVB6181]UXV33874.1 SDR family NAD(P)-dependent oxidoreductase [Staphylococcus sp. IVB6181]
MEHLIKKHFVVTGGTSGLGYAITQQLLKKGAQVTLLIRDEQKYHNTHFPTNTHLLDYQICDLAQPEDIKQLAFKQPIDGVIHSAGLGYFKPILEHTENEMLETYHINLIHFNLLLQQLKPYFNPHPYIVGISSLAAFSTQTSSGHYAASKAGFNQVLNTLRLENPNYHVLVVNAGPIRTPFHAKADPTLKYAAQVDKWMLDPNQLAQEVIHAMTHKKAELNRPKWLYYLLKCYQVNPRFFEKTAPNLFSNKGK